MSMNWEKIKEILYVIGGFFLFFCALYAMDYLSQSDERIKEELLSEVIPECAEKVFKDISKYDQDGNSYTELEPGIGLNFTFGENLSDCVSENYPE